MEALRKENQQLYEHNQQLESENARLQIELQNAVKKESSLTAELEAVRLERDELQIMVTQIKQPDYEAKASRVRHRLKIGEQSAGGKAIKEYIKELAKEGQQ